MWKYGGRVIFQSHDDDGILEVVDADGIRSLYFGSPSRQSSMLLSDPNFLQLSYSRTMMSWNLFMDSFNHALMVGLGGGSLVKYFLHSFPEGRITAIESRRSVVKISRSFFGLPIDPRLKIIIADGGKYIRQAAKDPIQQFDLVIIDAFNHEAMSNSVNGEAFFDACRQLLTPQGMMAINLWDSDKALYAQTAWQLSKCFEQKALFLPVKRKCNIIGLGFSPEQPRLSYKSLQEKAKLLELNSPFEFTSFLHNLKKNNKNLLQQVIDL